MIRRDFLKSALATVTALALPWGPRPHRHPVFGPYRSHQVQEAVDWVELPALGPYYRYLNFPTEVTLTVQFEYLTLTFCNFNGSRDLQQRLRQLQPRQLLASWCSTSQELHYADPVSVIHELYPERDNGERLPHKVARFRLACVNGTGRAVDHWLCDAKDQRWDCVRRALETLKRPY